MTLKSWLVWNSIFPGTLIYYSKCSHATKDSGGKLILSGQSSDWNRFSLDLQLRSHTNVMILTQKGFCILKHFPCTGTSQRDHSQVPCFIWETQSRVFFSLSYFFLLLLFYITFRYTVQWLDIYIIYEAMPPITLVLGWHHTPPLQ